jgi:pimeloyl-ACP methyl ester carboxylesterase
MEIIEPLTNPTAHGGRAEDAFDVVAPSMPGFGFSDKPGARGWNADRITRAWSELMRRLGYKRYVAQGGDWGAFVTTKMAQQHASGLAAIHLNFPQVVPDDIPAKLTAEQQRAIDALKRFETDGSGYFLEQATRPQTIGYPLADQAAWIYEKFHAWTDNKGAPEDALTRDQMQHHALLADRHGGVIGAHVFGERQRRQGQQCRRRRSSCRLQHLPARNLSGAARLGREGLPKADLLERGEARRPFRGVRGAGAVHG